MASFGGKGSSSSESRVTNDTEVINQQVAASEGGQAIGSHSSGNIINDATIISRAGDAIANVAGTALVASTKNVDSALAFGAESLGVVERTVGQANDILARSGETYAMRLQQNMAGELSPESQRAETTRILIYAVAAVALVFFLKGK